MVHRTLFSALAAAVLVAAPLGAQSAKHATRTTHSTTRRATTASTPGAWTPVYSDDAVTVSLDRSGTHRRADGTYDARLKWAYNRNMAIGRNKSYRTLVERRYIDCKTLASKPVSGQTYDGSDASVSSYTTSTRDLRYVDWATRPAGTSGAKAYAAVCAVLGKR